MVKLYLPSAVDFFSVVYSFFGGFCCVGNARDYNLLDMNNVRVLATSLHNDKICLVFLLFG